MRKLNSLCQLIAASAMCVSINVSAVIINDTPPDAPPPGTPPPTSVLALDSGWYGSCYEGAGTGALATCDLDAGAAGNSMSIDLAGPALLKVTALGAGDVYEVYINSELSFITSFPNINAPIFATDPDAAFTSPDYSSESLVLGTGSYSIDIIATAVNLSGLGISGIEVQSVPIPAAVWLFGSGLLGLVGISRCKKSV